MDEVGKVDEKRKEGRTRWKHGTPGIGNFGWDP